MTAKSTTGFREGATAGNQYTTLSFLIKQMLGKVRIATIVQVLAVSNEGGVAPVGTVDVQPLVHQTDGAGNITALPPVYAVPYVRLQGGANAVILDPRVGDLGIALFGDRDLSAVVATRKAAPPGSTRRNSLADALYIGAILNGAPQQYVRFSATGVQIVSPTAIDLKAPAITLDGAVHVTGNQTNEGTIEGQGDITGQGTSLHTHKHTGVTTGSGQSGPPSA